MKPEVFSNRQSSELLGTTRRPVVALALEVPALTILPRFTNRRRATITVVMGLAVLAGTGAAPPAPVLLQWFRLTPTVQTTAAPATVIPPTRSGIVSGDSEFNTAALVWQVYWLSSDQFGCFVMGSGMRVPFTHPWR